MEILRADPSTAHIPTFAIIAYALPQDVVKATQVGFFKYMTKLALITFFSCCIFSKLMGDI